MLSRKQLEQFAELPAPLLTAYICDNPADASRLSAPPYVPWLKDQGRAIAGSLSPKEQKLYQDELKRVEDFLLQRAPREKSLIIFSGSSVWELLPFQVELQNELHWGKPSLGQLLWLISEQKPYAIVAVDHSGARFFHYSLGQITEDEERQFAINVSEWRKKDIGKTSGQGVGKFRGAQRDAFAKRFDNQYLRLTREIAQRAAAFSTANDLAMVFLAGPDDLIKLVAAKFPAGFPKAVVQFDIDLPWATPPELAKHLQPRIASWLTTYEDQRVAAVTSGERGTLTGPDEILALLQKGRIRIVVVARDFDGPVHQCVRCGWVDRSADRVCPICSGDWHAVTLREVLPELAIKQQVEIEVVSGQAAERLKEKGGMGAWVRQPKSRKARAGL